MLLLAGAGPADAAWDGLSDRMTRTHAREIREILKLSDAGMLSRPQYMMDRLAEDTFNSDPEGYALLHDVMNAFPGYERRMEAFLENSPHSFLIPRIRYAHAMNLFDAMNYKEAARQLGMLSLKKVPAGLRVEYLFKKAYCHLENRELQDALKDFTQVEKMPFSDYTAPARYAIGYVEYQMKHFRNAVPWFEKSSSDGRFRDISSYYIMECRFMMSDHDYVTTYFLFAKEEFTHGNA